MNLSRLLTALLAIAFALSPAPAAPGPAAGVSLGESEALKCEDKIASVRRDVLGKYEDALGELQNTLQKAADLEGALAVRDERARLAQDHTLTERNYVTEPKSLRTLQTQSVTKMRELVGQIVADTVPKLVELKKSLTVAGKLDEAVAVRTAIEKLQNSHVPVARADAGSVVPADTLLVAYSGDRSRADKTYKGQRITVRGVVTGFRPDPADAKFYHVYLTGGAGSGWVQCAFGANEYRIHEDKNAIGTPVLIISPKDTDSARITITKGQTLDIRGVCEGLDEVVRLGKCDVPR